MDIALALAAGLLLALPMGIGWLIGHLRSVNYVSANGQIFKRWHIDMPDNLLGYLLTKTSLCNWPVLLNILRGDLAWVGPRPILESAQKKPTEALIQLRPGLVNIWELRRRTAVDFGTELDADLEYLALRGLRHDFGLLLRAGLVACLPSSRKAGAGRIGVGDVSFDNVDMKQAIELISQMLDGDTAQQVSFVNPACVNIAAHDRGYRRLLSRAALVLPDGIGIKIAADVLGVPLKQNVNGTDLFPRLCQMLEARGASLFLLGGQPGIAERVGDVIREQWPQLRIAGIRDGFFEVSQEGVVAAEVSASQADIVLVARGVPMQDVFIDRHLHQLGVKVAMGVGGLFDFVSGRINRAPTWMRDTGLEWIYRLAQEPSRMWQRYLVGNFTFLGRIVLQRLHLRHPANDEWVNDLQLMSGGGDGGLRTVLFATATAPQDIPVPNDFPTALLPFGWCTFAERAIEQLSQLGIRQIDLVVSSHTEDLRRLLAHGERWGVQLRWHLAKDPSTPYGVLRSLGLKPDQRVLLCHADRLIGDRTLASLVESDQIAVITHEQDGVGWTGWGSTTAGVFSTLSLDSDFVTLGRLLCQQPGPLRVLELTEFVSVNDARDLLSAQHVATTPQFLDQVPATWLRTIWGAYSPQAVIQAGALIEGHVLIGPGCFIAAGAHIGPGTVLTSDVVVSADTHVNNSLVLPQTFVGHGLELDETIVNARCVQHLRLGVRTVLPASDGLLLGLQHKASFKVSWAARSVAVMICLLFSPWLAIDTMVRRVRGLPLRWHPCLVACGRDADTDPVRLQTLRCAQSTERGNGAVLAHYGEWLDVVAGHRSWFGSRPRSQSEWCALGEDWQRLLSNIAVGCLHAPAWYEGEEQRQEARAAADVYFAVNNNVAARMRILRSVIWGAKSPDGSAPFGQAVANKS